MIVTDEHRQAAQALTVTDPVRRAEAQALLGTRSRRSDTGARVDLAGCTTTRSRTSRTTACFQESV